MQEGEGRDYFDKARAGAATLLLSVGASAIAGTALEWVTIEPPARIPREQAHRFDAFTGIETSDGWIVVVLAAITLITTLLMVLRKKALYAWIAFWCCMVIGGIAIADYRGIDELFYDEMNRIGDPAPAFGLTLVAASALVGIIASVMGVAASPRRDSG